MRPFFRPKLYLSARVSPDAHSWNNEVTELIQKQFDIFRPHEHQVCTGPHEDIGPEVYRLDITAMENCELALLLPPYGRDCAFELGWLVGQNKPVYAYVTHQIEWLRDAMVKGGLTAVFTSETGTYQHLKRDPILRYKTYFAHKNELGQAILKDFDLTKLGKVLIPGE